MSTLSFDDLRWLHLLWAVLAVGVVGLYGCWQRRRSLRRFASANLLPRLLPAGVPGWRRPLFRLLLICASLIALVAAFIGPRWGTATEQLVRRDIDVLVLLDVSRSMLAQDIAPSRLERAKLAIREDLLPALGGDRIGLITFAGVPSVACPLTTDYGFFRLALDDVTVHSAPRGGTLIGDAIRKAGTLLSNRSDAHQIVLLITDGEDHESYPSEAAAALWEEQRIPIIAIALGDPQRGACIPVDSTPGSETYIEQAGALVLSKADFPTLQRIAAAGTSGIFIPAGTADFDLARIYHRATAAIRNAEQAEQWQTMRPSRSHIFAAIALLLVLMDSFVTEQRRRAAKEPA